MTATHNGVVDAKVDAICMGSDLTGGSHCNVCGNGCIATDAEVPYTCTVEGCDATKTDLAPVVSAAIALNESYKLTIDFTKPDGYTGFDLYCYDSKGDKIGYSAIHDNVNATAVLPCALTSGKYILVVKGWAVKTL